MQLQGPSRARRISRYAELVMRLLEGRTGLEDVSGKRRRTIAELIDVGCGVQARPWSRERMPRAAVPSAITVVPPAVSCGSVFLNGLLPLLPLLCFL